ncbi:methyl-accepting chemotaxis protein [Ferrimicrobium sp.]|uniref:methyl-accepting chemotaxis protein n=1 Tax=Ferrimicrobium sp. TaxID=2926050 RepID=UPI002636F698|nr:methyl-accepting chemotaxis protein [Ferrimicrobium sp.]
MVRIGRRHSSSRHVVPAGKEITQEQAATIERMAEEIGHTGLLVVEAATKVESIASNITNQVELFKELTLTARDLRDGNRSLSDDATAAADATRRMNQELAQSRDEMTASLSEVNYMIKWVADTSTQLETLQQEMEDVGRIAHHLDSIAQQTHVLALNAHIEAARAGTGATGFTVIANAIRDLADQAIDAAASISTTLDPLIDSVNELGGTTKSARRGAERARNAIDIVAGSIERSQQEGQVLDHRVEAIATFSRTINEKVVLFSNSLLSLFDGVENSENDLNAATASLEHLMQRTNSLVQLSAKVGVATTDTPFVMEVVRCAHIIEARLEKALASGEVSIDILFDEQYQTVPGTNPQQHLTRFSTFVDQTVQDLLENFLDYSPAVVFAAVVDRNGYLSTHNLKYSLPQTADDPVWNAAHCRNHRFFDDPTGIHAARSRDEFLLQTYRRDMGGGQFRLMMDASAPIYVAGLHWGALRLGYAPLVVDPVETTQAKRVNQSATASPQHGHADRAELNELLSPW